MDRNSRDPLVIGVITLLLALSWITVPLRVYVRARMIKWFAIDDWMAVVTLVSNFLIELSAPQPMPGLSNRTTTNLYSSSASL